MEKIKDYSIEFKGLKDGKHEWDFHLTPDFFKLFDESIVENGDFKCKVKLDKSSTLLTFTFEIHGSMVKSCDDCLDDVTVNIDIASKLFVKFGDSFEEQSDEVVVVERDEHQFNVAQYIYEFIVLSIPLRVVHADDEQGHSTCNQAMLNKLNRYLVEEVDLDSDELGEKQENEQDEVDEDHIDPRWASLKKLIDNNKKEV